MLQITCPNPVTYELCHEYAPGYHNILLPHALLNAANYLMPSLKNFIPAPFLLDPSTSSGHLHIPIYLFFPCKAYA